MKEGTTMAVKPIPDGTVMHAQVKIGDSFVMMGEARGEFTPRPASLTCT